MTFRHPAGDVQSWRTDRREVHWSARYRARGGGPWQRCHVVDLSMHGCCLLLVDEVADGVDSIAVDLQPPSETISLVVSGNVRHSSRTADGRFRVGIEFVAIGSLEERFLAKVIAGLSQ